MDSCQDQIHPASTPLPKKTKPWYAAIYTKEIGKRTEMKRQKKKKTKNISCILTILHCNGRLVDMLSFSCLMII